MMRVTGRVMSPKVKLLRHTGNVFKDIAYTIRKLGIDSYCARVSYRHDKRAYNTECRMYVEGRKVIISIWDNRGDLIDEYDGVGGKYSALIRAKEMMDKYTNKPTETIQTAKIVGQYYNDSDIQPENKI